MCAFKDHGKTHQAVRVPLPSKIFALVIQPYLLPENLAKPALANTGVLLSVFLVRGR